MTPTVQGEALVYHQGGQEQVLTVGTAAWFAWLETASTFSFVSAAGNFTARREVVDAIAPQVQNGHVLDQTVWNYMFAAGTDELNGVGMAKLDYIVRMRPAPDPQIFVQTAQDVFYDPAQPDNTHRH